MKLIGKVLLTLLFIITAPLSIIFAKELVPSGENIGIELKLDGVMVANTYDVKNGLDIYNPARDSDIKIGDYISKINTKSIENSSDIVTYLKELENNTSQVKLSIRRDEKMLVRYLKVIKTPENGWKTGLLIKDKILSVGTLTFYDPETMTYAALGHEIVNSTSGKIVDISSGSIYSSKVTGIKKSSDGNPGQKIAEIDKKAILGSIQTNNNYGIYGTIDAIPKNLTTMESANISEINLGKASILTVTEANDVKEYSIEILALKKQKEKDVKGITFKVTDENLLNATNGIIQGMSGSPILQNGKIIGAVTHVMINNVTMGYGIFIEWMLEEVENIE